MATKLPYDALRALAYATDWCHGGNACPTGQIGTASGAEPPLKGTDCTHFMCHVLSAGGITVPGPSEDTRCSFGLMLRVNDLERWLASAAELFGNVAVLKGWQDAQAGDIGFQPKSLAAELWTLGIGDYGHVVMLAGPLTKSGGRIFGHQHNRCNEEAPFVNIENWRFYRIVETARDGAWTSTDPDKRFQLAIDGLNVSLTERRPSGKTRESMLIAKSVEIGKIMIQRSNDDETLAFLEFADPALRTAILARGPRPSFLTLTKNGDRLTATWNGLLVKKNPNGSLLSIVQPDQMTPKTYEFVRR